VRRTRVNKRENQLETGKRKHGTGKGKEKGMKNKTRKKAQRALNKTNRGASNLYFRGPRRFQGRGKRGKG